MPSLSHRVVSFVLPRLNPKQPIRDLEKFRTALIRKNEGRATAPPDFIARTHSVEERDAGFPAYVCTRPGSSPTRTILHLHGGSFTSASHPQQWRWVARLASRVDARFVFPAYPLAPAHTWRDSHDSMVSLAQALMEEGPLVISGDSAGGGFALGVAQTLRDLGGPQPTHLVLVAPWVDLTASAPGMAEAAARDPWLNFDNHDAYALFWAGTPEDLGRPEVSPGLGVLEGLPPTLMFCGTHDMLYPGCVALAARGAAAGWDLDFEVGHGLLHVYPILPISEARTAMRRAVAFLSG